MRYTRNNCCSRCVESASAVSFKVRFLGPGRALCLRARIIHHEAIFVRGKVAIGSAHRWEMRPALFGVLLIGATYASHALVAMAVKPAATTAKAPRAAKPGPSSTSTGRSCCRKPSASHFTAVAPAPVHDYRGEGGPPAVQAQDFNVNKTLEGATVRLPGFIVPLEAVKSGDVSEFLLVPYFGSCIHVPPPPPNQIVYVHTSKHSGIDSIYDAYWITGKLHLQTKTTRLGSTAYELNAEKIEVYQY